MKTYVVVRDDKVIGLSSSQTSNYDILMDLPNDHEVHLNPFIFKIVNGELVKDVEHQDKLVKERKERDRKRVNIQMQLDLINKRLDAIEKLLKTGGE